MSKCVVCHKAPVDYACGTCGLVTYCGEACQDVDWRTLHHVEHGNNDTEDAMNLVLPPHLYIGSIDALFDANLLKRHRIQAVVTAIHVDRVSELAVNDALDAAAGVKYRMRVSIYDHPDEPIERYFDAVADFIHRHTSAGRNVLVHCHAGMSRSVALVVYYMLKYHRRRYKTVEEALAAIDAVRPGVQPNAGFMEKLKRLT